MSNEQKVAIINRYNTFCYNFVTLADQVNAIEANELGLDLTETKDRMWYLINQIAEDRPSWF